MALKNSKNYKVYSDDRDSNILYTDEEVSNFAKVESYKVVRTNIMFSLPKSEEGKVIAITSSVPKEGKTTMSINLAITFAQTGSRVVLVDCDLRKPRVHRYLKHELGDGVSNIVCGYAELENCICKNVRGGLDIITSGAIPPNPVEILTSDEFKKMIDTLKQTYDYIFLDTPPVSVVTDAVVVSEICSGMVVVAKADYSTFDMVDYTLESLNKVNAKILGFILTNTYGKGKGYKYDRYKYEYYKSE